MQTAVDCNGSNNSNGSSTTSNSNNSNNSSATISNNTTIITTTTPTERMRTNDAMPTMTLTSSQSPNDGGASSVLRHRITVSSSNSQSMASSPKNGLTHLIDASDYLGSNVECLSSLNSSPQASPSTKRDKCKLDKLDLDLSDTSVKLKISLSPSPSPPESCSSSSSASASKTTSNSTSTTSSVIATPILKRNGNVFKDLDPNKDNIPNHSQVENIDGCSSNFPNQDDGGGSLNDSSIKKSQSLDASTTFRECTKQQQHNNKPILTTNQMLPFENTSLSQSSSLSFTEHPKQLSSVPTKMATMSSSTTSSSIITNASNASIASIASNASSASVSPTSVSSASLSLSASPSASASASSSSSSSSSSTSSPSPVSATTPALLPPSLVTTTSSSSTSSNSSSTSASPTASAATVKDFSKSKHGADADLLHWQDMPKYLQFNPYVLKGYRPLQTFKGCLLSMFCWHNETINILTHAIPIVYILAIVPGLMPWESGYRFLSFCHVFGSVAPWCGSFVYHLFMNIERGENVYYTLLKLDMVGIWVSQSFGALPLVTATTFCFSPKWKWLIIISYCLFSLWGLYKALTASSPWQRRLCFALPFTMRSVLTFFRTFGLVGGNSIALPHVYLQDGVSIIGGAIGAMRIPEKWFPGLVDFYLNSHNIMHVLVVVAVYSMHKATIKDFEWMSTTNCEAFTNETSKVLQSTLNVNIEL